MGEGVEEYKTTPAQENYIEAIYRMSLKGSVRPSTLAECLGVKRASVSKFIRTLVGKDLVLHKSHGDITLTDKGEELARAIIRRDECLTRLLVEVCGMTAERADPEVHRLEHVISDEVLLRLETLVEFACTSEAWLKRLHYRIENAWQENHMSQKSTVGRSQIHQGGASEKFG